MSAWSDNVKFAYGIVLACLLIYLGGFLAFYPRAVIVADEGLYIGQARAFAQGRLKVPVADVLTGQETLVSPSEYPAGTSLLQAPFVFLGGWRSAALASLLSLIATILLLARWLREEGRSPLFALLVLAYPPVLVLGRVAMSDLPSAAIVTLGLWLFWRGRTGSWLYWLASGLLAGGSLLFRETNALVFLPFFAGALLRREKQVWALVVGGLAGCGLRLLSGQWLYGSPFFFTHHGYGFSLAAAVHNWPLYGFALLVMVPGGLAAACLYRGPRRPEVITAALAYLAFYLAYDYAGWESSLLKQIIIGPRFFIPLLPVLVLAMAEVIPRLWGQFFTRGAPGSPRASKVTGILVAAYVAAVALAALAIHPILDRWSASQVAIVQALSEHTQAAVPIITNGNTKNKFLNGVYLPRRVVLRDSLRPEEVGRILNLYGAAQLVFLNRSDSEAFRLEARRNEAFVRAVGSRYPTALRYDQKYQGGDHLEIWEVTRALP